MKNPKRSSRENVFTDHAAAALDDRRWRRHMTIQPAREIAAAVDVRPEVAGARNVIFGGFLAQRACRFGGHDVDVAGDILALDPGCRRVGLSKGLSICRAIGRDGGEHPRPTWA